MADNEFFENFELVEDDMMMDFAPEDTVVMIDEDDLGELLPGSSVTLETAEEAGHEPDWLNDGDHTVFLVYLKDRLDHIPEHSGNTTVGCERAISYLRKLDKELSDAIRSDDDNKIDESEAEDIRDMIYDYISKLEEAHDKLMGKYKNKKASVRVGKKVVARINDGTDIQYFVSVANANGEEMLLPVSVEEPTDAQVAQFVQGEERSSDMQKSAGAGVYLFEDPFLHSITRLLIQSHITHGKNMEDVYANFKEKYSFTPREELSIHELLYQKGFPLTKDLGRLGEDSVKRQDGKGVEYSTEYFA